MVFNGDSDNQDICSLADDFVNTDDNLFPLQQKARFANKVMGDIWSVIFESYGGWQFDDSNNQNLPVATTGLVSGQQQYTNPLDAVSVRGVEVKTAGGSWQTLVPITEEEIRQGFAEAEFFKIAGQPMRYRSMDGILKLYPASDYSQASSLRMTFDRDMTRFVSTDTTKEPGFMSTFHDGVALGMATNFAQAKRLPSLQGLLQDWNGYLRNLSDYYSARWAERFPTRVGVSDYQRENQ